MKLNFDSIEEKKLENFKGGEKHIMSRMFSDDLVKIMKNRVEKGASIGYHTHDTICELIYVLKGTATVNYEGETELIHEGEATYCPKGHSHSLTNEQDEILEFLAIVPEQ